MPGHLGIGESLPLAGSRAACRRKRLSQSGCAGRKDTRQGLSHDSQSPYNYAWEGSRSHSVTMADSQFLLPPPSPHQKGEKKNCCPQESTFAKRKSSKNTPGCRRGELVPLIDASPLWQPTQMPFGSGLLLLPNDSLGTGSPVTRTAGPNSWEFGVSSGSQPAPLVSV